MGINKKLGKESWEISVGTKTGGEESCTEIGKELRITGRPVKNSVKSIRGNYYEWRTVQCPRVPGKITVSQPLYHRQFGLDNCLLWKPL